ncbi:hypothetical protein Golob_023923 [Gossypium lobatum]|uniref:Uncharacterized protein n=1 Tax=Gossypium lobatum TaxID=34289 RepID=A0A7J8NI66_9ROSI|nr:hypothetical protein [Gossypium lobatum]
MQVLVMIMVGGGENLLKVIVIMSNADFVEELLKRNNTIERAFGCKKKRNEERRIRGKNKIKRPC